MAVEEERPDFGATGGRVRGMTQWGWICTQPEHLTLGARTDIGAFTIIVARHGVRIGDDVQIGAGCCIYSLSTIDGKRGAVVIEHGAKIGAHSVVMPGITIGAGAVIGAFSFVNRDIPPGQVWWGVPARQRALSAS